MGSVVPQGGASVALGGACQRTHPHIRHTHCPRCRRKSQTKTPPYNMSTYKRHIGKPHQENPARRLINTGGRWEVGEGNLCS